MVWRKKNKAHKEFVLTFDVPGSLRRKCCQFDYIFLSLAAPEVVKCPMTVELHNTCAQLTNVLKRAK